MGVVRPFVHLHLHSQYSLLDGATRISDLLDHCEQNNMPAVAVTDHGNMFGAMEFYFKAQGRATKPIIGCEVYICQGSRFDKSKKAVDTMDEEDGKPANILNHLVLLVKNEKGYKNLCKLVTSGYLEGFYYKPRIDKEILAQHAEGLIALTSCLRGEVPYWLNRGKCDFAQDAAVFYKDLFGDDFYLEVQNHGIPEQLVANRGIADISKRLGVKIVATQDSHYLKASDAAAHDVLLCLQTQRVLEDANRMKFANDQFYVKNGDEMAKVFPDNLEYLDHTLEIADKIDYKVKVKDEAGKPIYHLPKYQTELPVEEQLAADAKAGLAKAFENKLKDKIKDKAKYDERLDEEIKMIQKTGFSGYFLIVADFINWAKKQKIPVGPGRGSGVGSLVAMSLGITDADPIEYNLLFERFINPDRVSMPDFDVDFCQERRNEVINYVAEKYGRENVSQIATFGKLMARGVLRDVGRVYGMPHSEMDLVAKLVPEELKITLEKAFEKEPELRRLEDSNPRLAKVFQVARALEGGIKSAGRHAAGVIITEQPLTEYCPLFLGKDGEIAAQYDKDWCEKIGLVKFDFLGLKNLTVISKAEKLVQKKKPEFSIDAFDYKDPKVFELIGRGDCVGIFQLEASSGMAELGIKLQPTRIEDINAMVALFRPGPMAMIDDFVDRKHGRKPTEYIFPELETALKETYGIMLYQEQVMSIARIIAGYKLSEADLLRRAMGKKKHDEMAEHRSKFIKGASERGFDAAKSAQLFDLMAKFADYGFNKSHAVAYSLITYQTGFLKAYYPSEYFAALLSAELDDIDKLTKYIKDAREHQIEILPPDVNESDVDFTVIGKNIRFGLGAIKGVGTGVAAEILTEKEKNGPYKDIFDFCVRINKRMNRKTLEALISVGAFDRISPNHHRNQLLLGLERIQRYGQVTGDAASLGQQSLFGGGPTGVSEDQPTLQDAPIMDEKARLKAERELVGFYISGHPLDKYSFLTDTVVTMTASRAQTFKSERLNVTMVGIIGTLRLTFTKKSGEKMAIFGLEDATGTIDCISFPESYRNNEQLLVKNDEPLVVQGELDTSEEKPRFFLKNAIRAADYVPPKIKEICVRPSLIVDDISRKLQELKFWAKRFPGDIPIKCLIRSPEGEVMLKLPEKVSVHSEACVELFGLFGKNVELVQ